MVALIDQREVETLTRLIGDLHIAEHRPQIARQLASINFAQPRPIDVHTWEHIKVQVKPFVAFWQQSPFTVAPPAMLNRGTFRLHLNQFADHQPIILSPGAVQRHVLIVGGSGAGKTTLAQQIAREAYADGLSVVTFDGKDDAAYFLTAYPDTLLLGPETPLPLLEVPSWLSRAEYTALLVRAIRRTWWGGQGLEQIGTQSLEATYRENDHPSAMDWHRSVRGLLEKGLTYNTRDRIDATSARLDRLNQRYPGIARTKGGMGISIDDLSTRSIYFGFRVHTEVEDFLTTWLLEVRLAHHRAKGIRNLHTVVLLDESLLLLHEDTITESASIAPTFPLFREFGIACVPTANNYRALPAAIKSNVSTHIVMSMSDATDAKAITDTLGLNTAQREYLGTKLMTGQCLLKTCEEWKLPILATFADIKPTKSITADEWKAAAARVDRLVRRPPLLTANIAAREESRPQPTPAHAPSSSPLPTLAAAVLKSRSNILSPREEGFLTYLCEHGVATVTETYTALQLKPMQGSRVQKKLVSLGLISEERIQVRTGRGQNHGTALTPTGTAYEHLNLTKPRLGRGSGAQHAWLLRTITEQIPHARIEVARADIVIAYNAGDHERLRVILQDLGCMIALNAGDAIAIEVETDPSKTADANIARNTTTGITAIIIAVLPAQLKNARKRFTQAGVAVVDVLALIDQLRGAP